MSKLDLVSSVIRITAFHHRGEAGTGTAWYVRKGFWLTAAHCIGDPQVGARFSGPFRLQIGDGGAGSDASVLDVDWPLDIALLGLDAPDHIRPVPVGALPAPTPFPDGVRWYSYGFPRAHTSGLHVDGQVTAPNGNVNSVRALQMTCAQGGLGGLKGLSGAPVCVNERAVGLIRFGPEDLKQAVIMATGMKDILARFPELVGGAVTAEPSSSGPGSTGSSSGGNSSDNGGPVGPSGSSSTGSSSGGNLSDNGRPVGSEGSGFKALAEERTILLVTLLRMLPAAFNRVVFFSVSGDEKTSLLPPNVHLSDRAIELVEYFEKRQNGLQRLRAAIVQVDRKLLEYVATTF